MNGLVQSADCRHIILIGETAIYNRIKSFLRSVENRYLVSFFKSDNAQKTIYCEQKKNTSQSYWTSVYDELIDLEEETLVINCGCYYIYPPALIGKKNLSLINFHNGLLPEYRGLNIPSWVIYNGEAQAGVTWHLICEKIDAGEILKKGSISIGQHEKAFQLCKRLFDLAYNLFVDLWEEWRIGKLSLEEQKDSKVKSYFYYGKAIPNDGIVDLGKDQPEVVYNTLRALDYGKLAIFPPVRLIDRDGNLCYLHRYWIGDDTFPAGGDKVFLEVNLNGSNLYLEVTREDGSSERNHNEHSGRDKR